MRLGLLAWALGGIMGASAWGQQWTQPTAEELAMTSQAGAPGAVAVILDKEEKTDDNDHSFTCSMRVKVLNEGGKDQANVELPYAKGRGSIEETIDSIAGRTIQPNGTVVPFTGKPYEKLVSKTGDYKLMEKVFTLPGVEVGSILEYRYRMRYDSDYLLPPVWSVQGELFVRKAHFVWLPSSDAALDGAGNRMTRVAYTPVLPPGLVVERDKESGFFSGDKIRYSLDAINIAPMVKEPYMLPAASLGYRVMFYYSSYATEKEFWQGEGNLWSFWQNRFIGPGPGVKAFVAQTAVAGESPEQTLRRLYGAVMTLENTTYTRTRSLAEDKASRLKPVVSADDVLERRRGNADQLAELFVAMARAAGMKAYVMAVADRSQRLFLPGYLSLAQLDDLIAIVNVNGKEMLLDPGSRYCSFGQLAWQHTDSGGLRQTADGEALQGTPPGRLKDSEVIRSAELSVDEKGMAAGTGRLVYRGNPALELRQIGLVGDETSVRVELKERLEAMLPQGMEVELRSITGLTDGNVPLVVEFGLGGKVGDSAGRRLLIPANLFAVGEKPMFPSAERQQVVMFPYPRYVQDFVRLTYADGMQVESVPPGEREQMGNAAVFRTSSQPAGMSVTSERDMEVGRCAFPLADYAELRSLYRKLQSKDQEMLVLVRDGKAVSAGGSQ